MRRFHHRLDNPDPVMVRKAVAEIVEEKPTSEEINAVADELGMKPRNFMVARHVQCRKTFVEAFKAGQNYVAERAESYANEARTAGKATESQLAQATQRALKAERDLKTVQGQRTQVRKTADTYAKTARRQGVWSGVVIGIALSMIVALIVVNAN